MKITLTVLEHGGTLGDKAFAKKAFVSTAFSQIGPTSRHGASARRELHRSSDRTRVSTFGSGVRHDAAAVHTVGVGRSVQAGQDSSSAQGKCQKEASLINGSDESIERLPVARYATTQWRCTVLAWAKPFRREPVTTERDEGAPTDSSAAQSNDSRPRPSLLVEKRRVWCACVLIGRGSSSVIIQLLTAVRVHPAGYCEYAKD